MAGNTRKPRVLLLTNNGLLPEGSPLEGYDESSDPVAFPVERVFDLAVLASDGDVRSLPSFVRSPRRSIRASVKVLEEWLRTGDRWPKSPRLDNKLKLVALTRLHFGGEAAGSMIVVASRNHGFEGLPRGGRIGIILRCLQHACDAYDSPEKISQTRTDRWLCFARCP